MGRNNQMTNSVLLELILALLTLQAYVSASENALNFMIIGDWGGTDSSPYYTPAEKVIADQMGQVAARLGSQFTISLGDNFYYNGVTDVEDKRFQETYENVFTANSLKSNWYIVLGNHDHYGNASAQLAYSKVSERWNIPDYYYTKIFGIPGTSLTVQIVFIDTVMLAGLTHPFKRSLPPDGPASPSLAEDQWSWIETTMATSKADWLIVCGHYPVWSIAEHGPTDALVQRLRPMLMKYKASAYFCGHDHDIQHIKEMNSSVNYFVSGAGHLTDSSQSHKDKIPPNSLKYGYGPEDPSQVHGAFNSVSITATAMNVTFYDLSGKEIYTTSILPTRISNKI